MSRPAGSSKLLRAMNESAALAHLLDPGMLTRADLRRAHRTVDADHLRGAAPADRRRPGLGGRPQQRAARTERRDLRRQPGRRVDAPRSRCGTSAPAGRRRWPRRVCDLTGTVRARVESRVDFLRTDPMTALVERRRPACATETGAPAEPDPPRPARRGRLVRQPHRDHPPRRGARLRAHRPGPGDRRAAGHARRTWTTTSTWPRSPNAATAWPATRTGSRCSGSARTAWVWPSTSAAR